MFAAEVVGFVEKLKAHKGFLATIAASGGKASVIIKFLGDGCLADVIPTATLSKLVDLGLALGIDCFVDPQS